MIENCEFCNNGAEILSTKIESILGNPLTATGYFFEGRECGEIELNIALREGGRENVQVYRINYCPMCGRKLKED